MDLRDVAANVVHDYPGGAPSLAPRINKNPTTLAHELNGTGLAKLGLLDAEKITLRTGDLRILEAFALNCGQMLVPLPEALTQADDDCMLRLADTAREFGELCKEVAGDLENGINDNELSRIDRGCGELIASIHAMREALARNNIATKQALVGVKP
ncbi:MAG: hypothetical protein A3I66_00715 [Burkholderiales bacterium RIFCSPLOWO2_02_FULL_57_36]|nr:MAG: hypothetical protein A3I66_00715 [Burkholderiales bacterium RIFCSPLOWO2_02_FULL_57_36]